MAACMVGRAVQCLKHFPRLKPSQHVGNCRAIHSVGGTSTGIFDRIDHLSIYSDDREPLIEFFRGHLGLEQFVPETGYCFGEDDTPFTLDMLHLGSGVGLEVYTDPDLKSWREYFGKKPGTVVNVGMQPTGFSLDRAQSLMLRQYVSPCSHNATCALLERRITCTFAAPSKLRQRCFTTSAMLSAPPTLLFPAGA